MVITHQNMPKLGMGHRVQGEIGLAILQCGILSNVFSYSSIELRGKMDLTNKGCISTRIREMSTGYAFLSWIDIPIICFISSVFIWIILLFCFDLICTLENHNSIHLLTILPTTYLLSMSVHITLPRIHRSFQPSPARRETASPSSNPSSGSSSPPRCPPRNRSTRSP